MLIRPEQASDTEEIRRVHRAAFPTSAEARLVDLLRERAKTRVSLVAEDASTLVGHALFSPVVIGTSPEVEGLGLAPVAVLPSHQRRGVGSRLIEGGLEACRRLDCPFVVVLGEPGYYARFGFARASDHGLSNEYGVDESFMVLPLRPGAMPAGGGQVRYAPEFAEALGP